MKSYLIVAIYFLSFCLLALYISHIYLLAAIVMVIVAGICSAFMLGQIVAWRRMERRG